MLIRTLKEIATFSVIQEIDDIQTVLFDLDGTLVDTECLHAEALFYTLQEIIPDNIFTISQLEQEFQGMSDSDVFQHLDQQAISLDQFLDMKNNFFIKIITSKKDIICSQMKSLLNEIKENGLKLGLVTASERKITVALLTQVKIIDIFDIIICRDDLEKSKPDPLPYLKAISQLNTKAENTIIFEDSVTGLAAAEASGAHYFKVTWF